MTFHHRLHFDIEYLQRASSLQSNHFGRWIHDRRVGTDRPPNGRLRIRHVDYHHLGSVANLVANADKLVTLHRQHVEADARLLNPDRGQL